mmetsp:Transcript_36815/g.86501  ORF Transcript_36815/g.86501 Transcript_36815/m.86501 type:complete len:258 (+) Transcript_36815:3165-3938(+)
MKSRPASTQPLPTPWCALCARSPGVGGSSSSPSTSRAAAPSSGSTAWLSCAAVSWSSQRPLTSSRECASRQASPARPASTSPTTCSTSRLTRWRWLSCARARRPSSTRGLSRFRNGHPTAQRRGRRCAWRAGGRAGCGSWASSYAPSTGGSGSTSTATRRCCGCTSALSLSWAPRWGWCSTAWATTSPPFRTGRARASSCSVSSASPDSPRWRSSSRSRRSCSASCSRATTASSPTSSPRSRSTHCCSARSPQFSSP